MQGAMHNPRHQSRARASCQGLRANSHGACGGDLLLSTSSLPLHSCHARSACTPQLSHAIMTPLFHLIWTYFQNPGMRPSDARFLHLRAVIDPSAQCSAAAPPNHPDRPSHKQRSYRRTMTRNGDAHYTHFERDRCLISLALS